MIRKESRSCNDIIIIVRNLDRAVDPWLSLRKSDELFAPTWTQIVKEIAVGNKGGKRATSQTFSYLG